MTNDACVLVAVYAQKHCFYLAFGCSVKFNTFICFYMLQEDAGKILHDTAARKN